MNIRYSTHKLREYLLDLFDWKGAMLKKVVVQLVAC
jgi:hypothetical protein